MERILGLDIGGANLKAATDAGKALTRPFPLWKHPEQLGKRLRALRAALPEHDRLAVTMTGELCDCYANKREGVCSILHGVEEAADGLPVQVWTTRHGLVDLEQARAEPLTAAAANWLALAHLAARCIGDGPALLVDCGSTTTDIVFLDGGEPRPRGTTDCARLASGELVYAGVRRTPVCAVLGMQVAAEFFATMLDVYLMLGLIPEAPHDTGTADGRPATVGQAHARLARLRCADADDFSEAEARALARQALDVQVEHTARAVDRVLADRPPPGCLVLAGSGEVLGRQVRDRHPRLASIPVRSMAAELGPSLSEAACAYAVARLAGQACPTS